ncbi:DEAD/DEAH box helicase [Mycobacteroides abscessus]|uniref:DEAD/DEAH box helicase n=1 Tax=Mycobacteroides abscessus TaxID=36809 RepID=UPI000D855CF3|nr:DEAD/DEAH box helicase family protein [Mycobacteroides abscessus]SPX71866.1 type III restriction enzyme, res subunit [Mycobacteroides abscessus]
MIAELRIGESELWWLREGSGCHGDVPIDPDVVTESLRGAFLFAEESEEGAGLRSPQLGALHAILANRSTGNADAWTVVMPTGTGKTDTMLAAYCHSPKPTLVMVPSDTLRTQVASSFATLGKLPQVGAIKGEFRCPTVLVLTSALGTAAQVDEIMQRANIVVATAQILARCAVAARQRLAERCERLYVDEAHHVAAPTWRAVADMFAEKEIVQFTATPYREDGQHLAGRVIYAYPLHLAQKRGYFAPIRYHSVVDLAEPDMAVARAAVAQLRADLGEGLDHLLMARVSSIARAKQVVELYQSIAPDLNPLRLDTSFADSTRRRHRKQLLDRKTRIIVCVNMLGEGYDLPALKIAAIHDPQKSLAVTLQFIGRFTRTGGDDLGDASAFVPLQVAGVDDRLRRLYGEDADWNEVISDLTEQHVGHEKERTEFEQSFGSLPHEIALRSIHPKMSTVTYRCSNEITWDPENIYELFEDRLLTARLGINNVDKVVWWVSREATSVRWGDFASFNELVHHLYVVHVDEAAGFLYVNSTNNATTHEEIAKAVGGNDIDLIRGETVYRILAKVSRRVPTNVGLLDAVSRTRRFSMHVGHDVLYAWQGEGGTKMKTNIFAHGFAEGRSVSFGASRKGRVWSHEEADDLHDWVKWVRQVGPAITDESISLDSVMAGFLLPESATVRPPHVPLSIEWPYQLIATMSDRRQVKYGGVSFTLLDSEFRITNHRSDGPLSFDVVTPTWKLGYEFEFRADGPPLIRATGPDGELVTNAGTTSLAAFLTSNGLLVTFEDELVMVEQGFLLHPNRERRLYPTEAIETFDWSEIDIKRESQGAERDPHTIQYRSIEILSAEADWDIVIDDDGSGELADIVLIRRVEQELEILFAHCKYSVDSKPGARIDDFYDVCGQAMKMNRAKSMPEQLTRRLLKREQARQADGKTGLITGSVEKLAAIVSESRFRTLRATVAIIQPGLLKSKASEDICALLGATDRFLIETYGMKLRVIASG